MSTTMEIYEWRTSPFVLKLTISHFLSWISRSLHKIEEAINAHWNVYMSWIYKDFALDAILKYCKCWWFRKIISLYEYFLETNIDIIMCTYVKI